MTDTLTNDRIKDLLINWHRWAKDYVSPTDDSISPMFRGTKFTSGGGMKEYEEPDALLVEEVLRIMHKPYQPEWWILVAYYGAGLTQDEIGVRLGIAQQTVSSRRLPMARRIFGEQWSKMFHK